MESIVEELMKGRDLTKQLHILIQKPFSADVAVSQQKELVDKIFGSLTEAISVISRGSCESPSFAPWRSLDSGEVCQILVTSGARRKVYSGQNNKRPAVKDPRDDCKRRRSSDSWIKVSSSMVDEYAWRKYGQKETNNSTFPRCYFRCTHKHDQGCKATKQVQKVQEEPIKYQITYFGHHTCRKILQYNLENIKFDSYSEESNLINFQPYMPSGIVFPSQSWPNSVEEDNKEVQSDLTFDELSISDSITWPDPITWPQLTPLMRSDLIKDFLPGVYSYASSAAYHGTDMDFFSECDNFTNCFESID